MTKNIIGRWQLTALIILVAGMGLAIKDYRVRATAVSEPATAQDLINLGQRVSSLEQRIIMMESSVRRLEQQQVSMSRPSTPAQPTRDPEVDRLRSHAETVMLRICPAVTSCP